jgi:hypothetical protein
MIDPFRYDITEGMDKETKVTCFMITCPPGKGEQAVDDNGPCKGIRCLYNNPHRRFVSFAFYSDARIVVNELNRLMVDESKFNSSLGQRCI